MLISEFKAKCIATIKEVNQSKEPVIITLRGRPIAEVRPLQDKPRALGTQERLAKVADLPIHDDWSSDWVNPHP